MWKILILDCKKHIFLECTISKYKSLKMNAKNRQNAEFKNYKMEVLHSNNNKFWLHQMHRMPKLIVTSMEQTLLPQIAMQSAYAMKILHFKMILVEYIVVYQAVYGGFQVSDNPLFITFSLMEK